MEYSYVNEFTTEQLYGYYGNLFKDISEQITKGATEVLPQLELFANEIFYRTIPFPDLSIAAIHWPIAYPQSIVQPVHAAMLCNFVARSIGIENKRRLSLVKAALTANIGMYDVFDMLANKQQSF